MSSFQTLLSEHSASSLLKQYVLDDFLGEHDWQVDLSEGVVDFGEGRVFPIQIIGTESESSGTWLWAWANKGSPIPASLLTCANTLREIGMKEGIEELTQAQSDLEEIEGHQFTSLACGVCNADAYYRGPYDGGAAFFLIQQTPLKQQSPASPARLIEVMSSVVSHFPVDHRLMVRSFLEQQGYTLTESPNQIVGSLTDGTKITVGFDSLGRISKLETTLT